MLFIIQLSLTLYCFVYSYDNDEVVNVTFVKNIISDDNMNDASVADSDDTDLLQLGGKEKSS